MFRILFDNATCSANYGRMEICLEKKMCLCLACCSFNQYQSGKDECDQGFPRLVLSVKALSYLVPCEPWRSAAPSRLLTALHSPLPVLLRQPERPHLTRSAVPHQPKPMLPTSSLLWFALLAALDPNMQTAALVSSKVLVFGSRTL